MIQPSGHYGALQIKGSFVKRSQEKPAGDGVWISGGIFVLEPDVIKCVEDDLAVWEAEPLQTLVREGQLLTYCHEGYWQAMETLREKRELERLWSSGVAPWKTW